MDESSDLVSIIVPVYNTVDFLPDCLRSIAAQTYEKIEVIVIDDGSTDASSEICKKFIAKDGRFTYIRKENGGLSSARNLGLDRSGDDFICFVDSDDFIHADFVRILRGAIGCSNSTLAMCGRHIVTGDTNVPGFTHEAVRTWSSEETVARFLLWDGLDGAVWDKMFARSMFDDRRFPVGRISEDLPVTMAIICSVDTVVHVGLPLYYYHQREGSITRQEFSGAMLSALDSVEEVVQIATQQFPHLQALARRYYIENLNIYADRILSSKRIPFSVVPWLKLRRRIIAEYLFILTIHEYSQRVKLKLGLFLAFPPLFFWAAKCIRDFCVSKR